MTRYITLAEYLVITELATSFAAEELLRSARIDLADSALHAPQAGFDDQDFYPDIYDKATVLCWRLARNHPWPDGNKRAAWATLTLFIDLNDGHWEPDPPDVDEAERAMVAGSRRRDRRGSPHGLAPRTRRVQRAQSNERPQRPTSRQG